MKIQKYFKVAIAVSLFFSAAPVMAATADYTHFWAFDDAGGRNVLDSKGQSGTMTGTSSGFGWSGGKSGTALSMDGTSGTGILLPDGFMTGSQGSLSVWFRMNELTDRNIIFSAKSVTDNNIYQLLSVDYEGRPQLLFRTDPSGADRKSQGGTILEKNSWYHLVLTANGQQFAMYINGEQVTITGENTGRWFPDFTNNQLSYRIGTSLANPMLGSFSGMIDEFRLYDRPLTLTEITELYNAGNTGTPSVPLSIRPTLAFSISTDSIMSGGSVVLNWSSNNVDSCTASDGWSEAVPTSGSRQFSKLTADAAFTLNCAGKGGTISQTVRVHVTTTTPVAVGTLSVVSVEPTAASNLMMLPPVSQESFTRNLTIGSRGEDVKRLQLALIQREFLAQGLSSGYFGQLTKSAVIKFQASLALPTTGFFGPMTRAKMMSAFLY